MKTIVLIISLVFIYSLSFSQELNSDKILKDLSSSACNCIDSIVIFNKSAAAVSEEISQCIDNIMFAYQLGIKTLSTDSIKALLVKNNEKEKAEIKIEINSDKSSKEYQSYYFEVERYLMSNCPSLKKKITSNDKLAKNSFSDSKKAVDLYQKGNDELKKESYTKAIEFYKKALKVDSKFAFAWDNIGLCFRKLASYDDAISAYKKSLEIDPYGQMPLQNIAIVYEYKKEYNSAIEAYQRLAYMDEKNPEIYYGIGRIYAQFLNNQEEGLNNMCKAYNLYIEQKSPYRTDAEKVIQIIFNEMKKQGKESKFYEILKSHHINPN